MNEDLRELQRLVRKISELTATVPEDRAVRKEIASDIASVSRILEKLLERTEPKKPDG